MGSRRDPHWAIAPVMTQLSPDTEAAQGVGTYTSSYTQTGSVPGHPEPADATSRFRPSVTGAQSQSIDLLTLRGGWPGRDGAAVAYRLPTEANNRDYRGWDDPNVLCDVISLAAGWQTAANWTHLACATIEETGIVVVVARSSTAGQAFAYNPRTGDWTTGYNFGADPGLDAPIALAYDVETRRLILWSGSGAAGSRRQLAYYSEDNGATWALYSRGIWDATIASTAVMKVATKRDGDWLAIVTEPGAGATAQQQFASSDRGITWQKVGATFGTGENFTDAISVVSEDGAGYAVYYGQNSANLPLYRRRIGFARSIVPDAAEEEIDGSGSEYELVVAVRDYDDQTYVFGSGRQGPTTGGELYVKRISSPAGTGGDGYQGEIMDLSHSSGDNARFLIEAGCASMGSIWVACLASGHSDVAGNFVLLRFGGWTNVEAGPKYSQVQSARASRSQPSGDSMDYVPFVMPEDAGWTRNGSAGTRSLDGSVDVGLRIIADETETESYTKYSADPDAQFMAGQAILKLTSGENIGSDPSFFDNGFLIFASVNDTTNEARMRLELGLDGLQLWDGSTSRATVALDMTEWVHLRWFLRLGSAAGGCTIWYKRDGDVKWTRAINDAQITHISYSDDAQVTFGHAVAGVTGTSVALFRLVSASCDASWLHALDDIDDADNSLVLGSRGLWYGKAIPGRNARYPVPDLTDTTEDVGYIAAAGGPTYVHEEVALPTAYRYAASHIYPMEAKSPRKKWVAEDDSEARFTWDMGANAASFFGPAFALLVRNAYPREFTLRIDDGAGGWTTVGTLDKGWSGINYTITGKTLVPRSGTIVIDRYFAENELVGGYVVCNTASDPVARRITRNTAGYWTTDTTVQRMRIEVAGIDGTETTAGSGELVHHSGVLVAYHTTEAPRRYMQVFIEDSQVVPGGQYEAGVIAVCRLVAIGAEPGWDWSDRLELTRSTEERSDGAFDVEELGPARRVWEYGWTDGIVHLQMRDLGQDPDYFGGSASSFAIGTVEDADYQIKALLEHDCMSGMVPVVVIPQLPATSTTITDPTLYLYGMVLSDSIGTTAFSGTEGVDETVRLDSLAVREIK